MDRRVKERLVGASILVVLVVLIVPELLSGPKPAAPSPSRPTAGAPEPIRNVTVDLATNKPPTADASETASTAGPPALAAGATSAAGGASTAGVATGGGSMGGASVAGASSGAAAPGATAPGATAPGAAAPGAAAGGVSAGPASSGGAPTVTTLPAAVPSPSPAKPLETLPSSPTSNGNHAWAVQLGSFASRPNADKLAHQLKAQGFAVYVLSGGTRSSLRYRVRIGPLADRGAAAQELARLKAVGHSASIVPPGL